MRLDVPGSNPTGDARRRQIRRYRPVRDARREGRLGVRDDAPEGEDDAVWIDARFCAALTDEPAPAAAPTAAHNDGPVWDEAPPAQSYEMPPLDDGPPLDDSDADRWASTIHAGFPASSTSATQPGRLPFTLRR